MYARAATFNGGGGGGAFMNIIKLLFFRMISMGVCVCVCVCETVSTIIMVFVLLLNSSSNHPHSMEFFQLPTWEEQFVCGLFPAIVNK